MVGMKFNILAILCLSMLPVFGGMAAHAKSDVDTLTIGIGQDVGPLDLARSMRMPPAIIIFATNETLISRTTDPATRANVFEPELARSWVAMDDGKVWLFELEDGHKFDDGSEVTADAVKYTFDRIFGLNRGTSSSYSFIKRVEVIDKTHVKFHLDGPHPLFLPLLADAAAAIINPKVQKHAANDDYGSQWLSRNTAGSGPYRLGYYEPGNHYILEKNPHHHTKIAGIRRVVIKVIKDESIRRIQLQGGDIDMAFGLGINAIEALEHAAGIKVESGPSNAFTLLGLNTERGIMADRRVRQAISQVIDYEALIEGIFSGRAEVFRGPLPIGHPGADPSLYPVSYDLTNARRMIKEAGIPKGRLVRILYPAGDPQFEPVALVIQASMQQIGLNARLHQMTLSSLVDSLGRGTYDAVLLGWVGESNDPAILVNYWLDSSRIGAAGNFARYKNEKVDKLLRASIHETNRETRAKILHEAISVANRDWPYIYLIQRHQWIAYKDSLEGYAFNPNNSHDFKFERIMKTR